MSILQLDIPGARVLDLFAGSGALGLECLSRGAGSADFVEQDRRSVGALLKNIESLDAGDQTRIHRSEAFAFVRLLEAAAFDIAFADPPYASDAAVRLADHWMQTPFASILGVEHASSVALPGAGRTRRYGSTSITIFRSEG